MDDHILSKVLNAINPGRVVDHIEDGVKGLAKEAARRVRVELAKEAMAVNCDILRRIDPKNDHLYVEILELLGKMQGADE